MYVREEIDCEQARNRLDRYTDGEMSLEGSEVVAAHLKTCPVCAQVIEDRERVKEVLRRAVQSETAPDALRINIQNRVRAHQPHPAFTFAHRQMAIAAVLLVAVCLSVWGVISYKHHAQPPNSVHQAGIGSVSAQTLEVLNVGLGDHVHCAIQSGFADKQDSYAEMSGHLGAKYINLVSLVKERAGAGYEVIVAHRCLYGGREFVHLILKKKETILSLLITEKNGESFSPNDSAATIARVASQSSRAADVPLYQGRLQGFEIAGFETKTHLAFVVSNLQESDNLQFTSNVAPSVHAFLNELEA